MAQTDDLLRCFLAEELAANGTTFLAARALADSANARLPTLIGPEVGLIFSRADVNRVLECSTAQYERHSGGWRLRHEFQVALSDGGALRPEFSPLRSPEILGKLHAWQRQALAEWQRAACRGIVSAVTGAGKTLLGIAAIEAHLRVPSARAAVLVPTIELMHQWCAELSRAFFVTIGAAGDGAVDSLADHAIVVFVARSGADLLVPQVSRQDGSVLLVADECHRYGAESYARAIKASFAAALGLSATPERDYDSGMERHVFPALGPVVFDYQHEQAVAENVVSDFQVLFAGVSFEPVEQRRHDELSQQIAHAYSSLCKAHPYLRDAPRFVEAVKVLAGRDEDELALRWLSLVAERRRLLCSAQQRHRFVEWLAVQPELQGIKMLVFHESIADSRDLADALARNGIPAVAHHSDLDRFKRAAALSRFAAGAVQAIVSPHTLDEGIDVPDAALAIIVAGSRVKRQSIQRAGRVLRRTANKRHAVILRVFVRSGADDPTGTHTDRFSKAILENGRGQVAFWPEQSRLITGFIRDRLSRAKQHPALTGS